jgi:DNA-binding transcriptional ArsR family regulator
VIARPSVPDRIIKLLGEIPGRTCAQLARVLDVGVPHTGSALRELYNHGRVRREQNDEGKFVYYLPKETP